jgi:hypothetical protein
MWLQIVPLTPETTSLGNQLKAKKRMHLFRHLLLLLAMLCSTNSSNTVLAWVEGNWTEVADFVISGNAKGAVNAISAGGMWGVSHLNGSLTINQAAVEEHRKIWQSTAAKAAGIRTFPVIGFGGNISVLRQLFAAQDQFITALTEQIQSSQVDGVNIDFEPQANVHDKSDPYTPTVDDGAAFAEFLDRLSKAVHKLPGRPTVSMDSESIVGACWSTPPNPSHTWDYKPCPWIRNFWDFNRLVDTDLDRVIPMDTYTLNSTEFPFSLWYYQKYFSIDRLGFGVWPTKQVLSAEFAASRVNAFERYGANWISNWVINPGTKECPTWADVEERWAPWIPLYKTFLGNGKAVVEEDHLKGAEDGSGRSA